MFEFFVIHISNAYPRKLHEVEQILNPSNPASILNDQLEAPAPTPQQPKPRASDPVTVLTLIQAQEKKQQGRLEIYGAVEAAYDRVHPDDDSALDADKLGRTADILIIACQVAKSMP